MTDTRWKPPPPNPDLMAEIQKGYSPPKTKRIGNGWLISNDKDPSPHKCHPPNSWRRRLLNVGAVWKCDCGQAWVLRQRDGIRFWFEGED